MWVSGRENYTGRYDSNIRLPAARKHRWLLKPLLGFTISWMSRTGSSDFWLPCLTVEFPSLYKEVTFVYIASLTSWQIWCHHWRQKSSLSGSFPIKSNPIVEKSNWKGRQSVITLLLIFLLFWVHHLPGPTFIKPDQRNPWIKDQLWNDLLSTILHLQLPNFVSCGRDKPSHMTQNLVTVGVKL